MEYKDSLSVLIDNNEIFLQDNRDEISNAKGLRNTLKINRNAPFQVEGIDHVTHASEEIYAKKVDGIVGMIEFLRGSYLILITESESVGNFEFPSENIHKINVVKQVSTLLVNNKAQFLSEEEERDEKQYLQMISDLLSDGSFYFSHTLDLSNSIQRISILKEKNGSKGDGKFAKIESSVWSNGDQRFLWNSNVQKFFLNSWDSMGTFDKKWFVPLIQGFFQIHHHCHLKIEKKADVEQGGGKVKTDSKSEDEEFSFGLLSRRSSKRVGTRLHSRGADHLGNVSNYVETEQFFQIRREGKLNTCSFLQVRGSIPIIWNHEVNLDYDPAIVIQSSNSNQVLNLHFKEQIQLYQKQVVVNLVKEKGGERELGLRFEEAIKLASEANRKESQSNVDLLRYIPFDVAKHCGHSKFDNLSLLIDKISEKEFKDMGYFVTDGTNHRQQVGTFRTNCKDCLDRTNLVQGLLGKLVLIEQLKNYGLIKIEGPVSLQAQKALDKADFFFLFRSAWGDNGDAISIQYAGTPALKRDVTRIGKQTARGILGDGFSSMSRYVYNNMVDSYKQDSMILFTGDYQVSRKNPSPFSHKREFGLPSTWLYNWVSFLLGLLLSVFATLGPKSLKQKGYLLVISVCLVLVWFVSKMLRIEGKAIVNIPRLISMKRKNQ
eukprot:TRINITY_DN2682_c0_g1_i1.p1 TRINITY_DN2682_c0_g1~~TRINITY_DN2682_c0_g1_i1.p1  ORF type:complete len:660 (+),score=219.68 TRINITY_DN2682_c0_g1_i1:50-2029(+)